MPFSGSAMGTPAPALLPALAAAAQQGLPAGGWVPRNSIVRDALQVCLLEAASF